MVTDLKLNYGQLELIQSRIEDYYNAVDNLEVSVNSMKTFLSEQESDAVKELKSKLETTGLDLDNRKEKLLQLKNILSDYLAEMQGLVSAVSSGEMTRVDIWDTTWNIGQMEADAWQFQGDMNTSVGSGIYFAFTEDGEEEKKRRERNYQKMENFRTSQLKTLANSIVSRVADIRSIYNNYLEPYETLDDDFKKQIDGIYDTLTSSNDKIKNNWELFGDISKAFIEGLAICIWCYSSSGGRLCYNVGGARRKCSFLATGCKRSQ